MSKENEITYPVYRAMFVGSFRDHAALFVQTHKDKTGTLIHVQGSIETKRGMSHSKKLGFQLETSQSYLNEKHLLGRVKKECVDTLWTIAESIPAPPCQFDANGPIREPLIRCREWMVQYEKKLVDEGVLVDIQEAPPLV